jgi:hypothetical protein
MPFPATAWNINVINSGSPQGGNNLQSTTFERVGTMPPQTGMPVYVNPVYRAFGPPQFIKAIDPWYGFIATSPSGGYSDLSQSYVRHYPNQVFVFVADAVRYGWPSGANNVVLQNPSFGMPTGSVRSTNLMPGGGFTHG